MVHEASLLHKDVLKPPLTSLTSCKPLLNDTSLLTLLAGSIGLKLYFSSQMFRS